MNYMNTIFFLFLIPIIGFLIAFYLDFNKPKRDFKEKIEWENLLGKHFDLEKILKYHIDNFGKSETKARYKHIVSFMQRIGKDVSNSSDIYNNFFNN